MNRLGVLVAGLLATLIVSGCAVSPSTGDAEASQSSQSLEIPQSDSDVTAPRGDENPLSLRGVPALPFQVWLPAQIPDPRPALAGLNGPTLAVLGRDFLHEGSTSGETDAEVFALMEGDVAFGAAVAPTVSRPTVGLFHPSGEFTAWSEVPGVQEPAMLPGSAPFQSLNATGAAASGPLVVWMSVGAGGKQWSLMAWNTHSGAIAELASSVSMTLGFTGISATVLPGLEPPEVNGRFAYFQVAIPQNVYEAATPGMRFHEIEVTGQESVDYDVAVFRVALEDPGDVVFVGPSAQIDADPQVGEGVFWVSSPTTVAGDQRTEEEVDDHAQSETSRDPYGAAPELISSLDDLSLEYDVLADRALKEPLPAAEQPNLILWADDGSVHSLLGLGPAEEWAVSDLDASPRYLAIALTKMGVVRGEETVEGDGPPSWIIAVDLDNGEVVGAAKSEVAVPDVFISGDLVVWSAAADLSEAADGAVGEVSDEGASDAFVWRVGSESVYQLASEDAVVAPRIFGDRIAIRQADNEGQSAWAFLQWLGT